MAVTKLEITSRHPFANGQLFGRSGGYELLSGTAHYSVDPKHNVNSLINDIELAPVDNKEHVCFSADFHLLKPIDIHKGNGRLLLDVPNRGRPRALKIFNNVPDSASELHQDAGTGFLMQHGYTVVWSGWQHDVPPDPNLIRIQVPNAITSDGQQITGKITVSFQPSLDTTTQYLSDRNHIAYPTNNLEDWDSILAVQDYEDGPTTSIPRAEWSFNNVTEQTLVPDPCHITMKSGFKSGKVYRLTYSTTGCPVVGLGLLATRDIASFLKYSTDVDKNPCVGGIVRNYAFGQSQSGRFLRLLLYLGLNQDEQNRLVFEGLIPHVAGGRKGEFNHRFAQPSSLSNYSANNLFPFADQEQVNPHTGKTSGLLTRLSQTKFMPKIMLTNTPSEYWGGHCALIHSDATGFTDLEHADSVRIYYFAGTQHASGTWPLTRTDANSGVQGMHFFNWVDYRPLLRAALINLDQWVSNDLKPPPSKYPTISDMTLVDPNVLSKTFQEIPELDFPTYFRRIHHLDFGIDQGNPDFMPPKIANPYPNLVPMVNQDGNETSGILLPAISVPVATCAGWNTRSIKSGGQGQIIGNIGSTVPFAHLKSERVTAGDPRLSLEERYGDKSDYLRMVSIEIETLINQGYLLREDETNLIEDATRQYDSVGGHTKISMPTDN